MPVVYNLADIFVLPSKTETWGLAINEAMACKKTVLASDKCGAVADLVENGVNGYTFKSGNVDDLEEKMRRLVKSRDELQIMGNASFKKIQEYSFENICTGVEKLLLSEV
jgi:glycosyltransferase involved in cell wall biosynthesis